MPVCYRFRMEVPLNVAGVEMLLAIPGVQWEKWRGVFGSVLAPDHAALMVDTMLREWGAAWTYETRDTPMGRVDRDPERAFEIAMKAPELNRAIPSFLRANQRAGIGFAGTRDGGTLVHPCGTGKALSAICWSLALPGAVLFVTRAMAIRQLGTEMRRFTTLHPFQIEAEEPPEARAAFDANTAKGIASAQEALTEAIRVVDEAEAAATAILGESPQDPLTMLTLLQAEQQLAYTSLLQVRAQRIPTGLTATARAAAHKARGDSKGHFGERERACRHLLSALPRAWDAKAEAQGRVDHWTARHSVDASRTLADYLARCAATGERPYVLASWDSLTAWKDQLLAFRPTAIVWDESQFGKAGNRAKYDYDADRDKLNKVDLDNRVAAAAKLARVAHRRLCTTATPCEDKLRDLWGQLDLAEPDAWGKTASRFRIRYCGATATGWQGALVDTGESNVPELRHRLAYAWHLVSAASVAKDMPPKRRMVTVLTPAQLLAPTPGFNERLREAAKKGGTMGARECGRLEASARKRPYVIQRTLEAVLSGLKVLVFSGRREMAELEAAAIRKAVGDRAPVWFAHGESSLTERKAIQDAYMGVRDPDTRAWVLAPPPGAAVIVGTYDAWGTSLNLQDTDLMLITTVPISPGDIDQYEGRGHRFGGRNLLVEYVLADGTPDMDDANIVIRKLPAVERVTDDTMGGLHAQLAQTEHPELKLASVLDKLGSDEDEDETSDDTIAAMAEGCPLCDAAPMVPCNTRNGEPHAARVSIASARRIINTTDADAVIEVPRPADPAPSRPGPFFT